MVRVLKIFILVFASISYGQNTFTGNVSLNSQSDVNTFATQNYDAIDGNLTFAFNTNINDLSGLASLKSITGNLTFNLNPQLLSLEGLHNLTHIGQSITIFSNSNLTNIDALENITTVGGNIDIANNADLLEIEGLRNIKDIGGYLRIDANSSLQSLSGLNALDTIGVGDAPTSPGPPSSPIDNASVIIVSNSSLGNCCLLNRVLNSATGVIDISNNLVGCNTIAEVENSISSCALEVLYPKLDDVYVAGRTITLAFEVVPIINNQNFSYEYSIDSGTTWNNAGIDNTISTSNENELQLVEWTSITSITEPTDVIIRIQSTFNGNQTIVETPVFQIHPSNYYASLGFRDDGISDIVFPLIGNYPATLGWFNTPGSDFHVCMDQNGKDLNYFNILSECGKTILAPFNGTVIFIDNDSTSSILCGDPFNQGPGNQIVIQSLENKTFVIKFTHLKTVNPNINVGDIVSIGDVLGKVGGSGTGHVANRHLHCSLTKNVYERFPVMTNSDVQTYTVLELLKIGDLFTSDASVDECNTAKINFSAEFDFIPVNNPISTVEIVLETISDLSDYTPNTHVTIASNLVLGLYGNNDRRILHDNSSNIINSTLGLESFRSIDGNLVISNSQISDLSGLSNLLFVGGDLIIEDNSMLYDYCGLSTLISNDGVMGDIIIAGNLYNPVAGDIITDNCSDDSVLSIEVPSIDNDIIVYPNPIASGSIIKVVSNELLSAVRLYDANGKELKIKYSSETKSIKLLEHMASGIYFLKLYSSNTNYYRKLVID
jgi:hypothetical protein